MFRCGIGRVRLGSRRSWMHINVRTIMAQLVAQLFIFERECLYLGMKRRSFQQLVPVCAGIFSRT